MKVGIPVEVTNGEFRVGATPKTIKRLIKQGFEVSVEKGAGISANISDENYTVAGAKVIESTKELYANSDIILKVQPVNETEIDLMHKGQVVLSYLYPFVYEIF